MRLIRFIICFVTITGLLSCNKDPGINHKESEIVARITLKLKNEEVISKSTALVDNVIGNVNILVFDINGTLLKHYYFEESSYMSIECSSGSKTIVAVANVGYIGLSSGTSLDNLRNTLTSNMANLQNQCIMTGEENIELKSSDNITIEMIRLISKITVVFNKEQLDEGTTIAIKNISLKNVPSVCSLLSNNKPVTIGEISETGDYIDFNLEPSAHEQATPLYLFENMQGDIGPALVESQKSPGESSPFCSYIEIKADYINKAREGIIKYRFYLGNNITNNFDVRRNTWYQLYVVFKEDAINEVSWRIDTTEITNVLYMIEAAAQPEDGGTVGGGGFYKYGVLPELSAIPNTNYTFSGWSPALATVTENTTYTAIFQYTDPTIHVSGVTLSKDTLSLNSGFSCQLTANVQPGNASNKSVVWSSSDTNVAIVDQSGFITALSAGTASISVTTSDGGYTASCSVKVFRVIKLYFHIERTAKMEYKNDDGGYWYLCEPIRDDIYVKSNSGDGIPGTITYSIDWAYDPASGFPPPEPSSATESIIISNTLNKLLETGNAWGNETDFTIGYPTITIIGISPSIMTNPPTKIIVDQDINTYHYNETGR